MAMVKRRPLSAAAAAPGAPGTRRWPSTGNQASNEGPSRQLSISISSDGGGSQECPSPSPCPVSRPAFNVFRAAEAGDMEVMMRFLSGGGDANKAGKEGYTILHLAAMRNQEKMVELLLSRGADPDAHDYGEDLTPLMWAAQLGHVGVAVALLEGGADSEQEDREDLTALHWAARMGKESVARALLDHNADFEAQDYDGNTPLIWAAREGHRECVNLLLDRGALTTTPDENGNTALHFACQMGNSAVASDLLDWGALSTAQDYWQFTPFHRACSQGHGHVLVELLKSRGAGTSDGEEDGGDMSTDSSVGGSGAGGGTRAWGRGAGESAPEVALSSQVIDLRNHFQATPLHRAAAKGHAEVVSILLQNGASVNARDGFFYTPLHLACTNSAVACVQVLLENGADPTTKAQGSITPLQAARKPEVRGMIKTALAVWNPAKSGIGGPLTRGAERKGRKTVGGLLDDSESSETGLCISIDLSISVDNSSIGEIEVQEEVTSLEATADEETEDRTAEDTDGDNIEASEKVSFAEQMGFYAAAAATAVDSTDDGHRASSSDSNNLAAVKPPLARRSGLGLGTESEEDDDGPKGGAVTVKTLATSMHRKPSWSSPEESSSSWFVTGMEVEDPGWNRPVVPPALIVPAGRQGEAGHRKQDAVRSRRVSTGAMLSKVFKPALSRCELPPPVDEDSFASRNKSESSGGRDGLGGVAPPPEAGTNSSAVSPFEKGERACSEQSTSGSSSKSATLKAKDDTSLLSATNASKKENVGFSPSAIVIPPVPVIGTATITTTTSAFPPPPATPLHKALPTAPPRPLFNTTSTITTQPQPTMLPEATASSRSDSPKTTALATAGPGDPLARTTSIVKLPPHEGMEMAKLLAQTEQVIKAVDRRGRALISTIHSASGVSGTEASEGSGERERPAFGLSDTLTPVKRRAKSLPPFWPGDERRARRKRDGEPRLPRKKIEGRPCMEGATAVIKNLTLDDVAADGDGDGGGSWGSGEWVSSEVSEEVTAAGTQRMVLMAPEVIHIRRATTTVG